MPFVVLCLDELHDAQPTLAVAPHSKALRRKTQQPKQPTASLQAVSIAQKTSDCGGGYASDGTPGASLTDALQSVDTALLTFIVELEKRGVRDDTVIIVSAKHGQVPVDSKQVVLVDDALIGDTVGDNLAALTADSVALIWLIDNSADLIDDAGVLLSLLLLSWKPGNRCRQCLKDPLQLWVLCTCGCLAQPSRKRFSLVCPAYQRC
jgi:Type I phosphodiesterase / nucleotide pyrophosphatase